MYFEMYFEIHVIKWNPETMKQYVRQSWQQKPCILSSANSKYDKQVTRK